MARYTRHVGMQEAIGHADPKTRERSCSARLGQHHVGEVEAVVAEDDFPAPDGEVLPEIRGHHTGFPVDYSVDITNMRSRST
jgi:hypothetical protein